MTPSLNPDMWFLRVRPASPQDGSCGLVGLYRAAPISRVSVPVEKDWKLVCLFVFLSTFLLSPSDSKEGDVDPVCPREGHSIEVTE